MATVYLNAATGNDANTYAQAQNSATPWLTLGKVQTSANTGDTVNLTAGTYTWADITFTKSFTWIGAATVNGMPSTIINGAAANVRWLFGGITSSFSRMWFKNIINTSVNTGSFESNAINNNTSFVSCVFSDIALTNLANYALFREYQIGTNTVTFTGCLFYNIGLAGAGAARFLTTNNTTVSFINCTIYNSIINAGWTYNYIGGAGVGTFKNCIIYHDTSVVLTAYGGTLSYSCVYPMTLPAGTGNLAADCLFVDKANNNFNLRSTSPCIDMGTLA